MASSHLRKIWRKPISGDYSGNSAINFWMVYIPGSRFYLDWTCWSYRILGHCGDWHVNPSTGFLGTDGINLWWRTFCSMNWQTSTIRSTYRKSSNIFWRPTMVT